MAETKCGLGHRCAATSDMEYDIPHTLTTTGLTCYGLGTRNAEGLKQVGEELGIDFFQEFNKFNSTDPTDKP